MSGHAVVKRGRDSHTCRRSRNRAQRGSIAGREVCKRAELGYGGDGVSGSHVRCASADGLVGVLSFPARSCRRREARRHVVDAAGQVSATRMVTRTRCGRATPG